MINHSKKDFIFKVIKSCLTNEQLKSALSWAMIICDDESDREMFWNWRMAVNNMD